MDAVVSGILTSLALLLIDAFLVRDWQWFSAQGLGQRFIFNQALSALTLLTFVMALQALSPKRTSRRWPLAALFGLAAFLQAAHFSIYRELVSPFGVLFFLSNPGLTLGAGVDVMSWWRSLGAGFAAAGVMVFLAEKPLRKWVLGLNIFVCILGVVTSAVYWLSVPSQQNSFVASAAALIDSTRVFGFRKANFTRPKLSPAAAKTDAPNIVWVIGESLNRANMSLYGYERKTTPELDELQKQGALVRFDNVTTIGIHTLIAVPYMLVGMEGIDPHGIIFSRPTVFAYARAAGYRTAFLSAQDTRWGNLESLLGIEDIDVFRNGNAYSSNVSVHKGADDLDVAEKGLIPFIRESKGRYLAVMQMDGSHYPYTEHSPAAFKRFLPEIKRNSLNAYDNTVVYTDHVLASLVRQVRAADPKAWIFFSPDHADGVKRYRGMFHTPTSRGLMHVPFVVFPPESERARLAANAAAPVSQADILPTILEIMGLKPQAPLDGFSLFSPISESRVRVVSAFMSTLSPDPVAMLVFPDGSTYRVDLERRSVTISGSNAVMKLDDLDPSLRTRLEERLDAQDGSDSAAAASSSGR